MENTEVGSIKRNIPECVAASKEKLKKMKLASSFYYKLPCPLEVMEITTLIKGMFSVVEMCNNIFYLICRFETVKSYLEAIEYFNAAVANMPIQGLQYTLCGTSNNVVMWHHLTSGAFICLNQ